MLRLSSPSIPSGASQSPCERASPVPCTPRSQRFGFATPCGAPLPGADRDHAIAPIKPGAQCPTPPRQRPDKPSRYKNSFRTTSRLQASRRSPSAAREKTRSSVELRVGFVSVLARNSDAEVDARAQRPDPSVVGARTSWSLNAMSPCGLITMSTWSATMMWIFAPALIAKYVSVSKPVTSTSNKIRPRPGIQHNAHPAIRLILDFVAALGHEVVDVDVGTVDAVDLSARVEAEVGTITNGRLRIDGIRWPDFDVSPYT